MSNIIHPFWKKVSARIHFPLNCTSQMWTGKIFWLIPPIFSCLERIIGGRNLAFLELLSVFFFSSKNLAKRVQGSTCCCSNNKIKSYTCLFFASFRLNLLFRPGHLPYFSCVVSYFWVDKKWWFFLYINK